MRKGKNTVDQEAFPPPLLSQNTNKILRGMLELYLGDNHLWESPSSTLPVSILKVVTEFTDLRFPQHLSMYVF